METTKPRLKTRKKKKRRRELSNRWKVTLVVVLMFLLSPFYYGYIIKGFASTLQMVKDWRQNPNYRRYKSFHIKIPINYKIHGIDVSYYQGKIDWKKVKEMREDEVHIQFSFIKATEGLLNVDPYFKRNWREAPKAGIVRGAYHFFRPKLDGKAQAKFFLQVASVDIGDLPPVVDVESLDGVSPQKMRTALGDYLNYIELKTKIRPVIYTGLRFYENYIRGDFDEYPLWIAHYHQPKLRVDKSRWKFWQHSDRAKINGINHVVDFNAFNGDSIAFEKILVK
ncbi:lysozyme [Pedobacter sp. UYEF25]